VGEINHALVGSLNEAFKTAYTDLKPRGPAKWLLPLFDKIGTAVGRSQEIATRNKTVFWDPFGNGMAQIGQAFGGPGAYWYAKKAGVAEPTAQTIQNALSGGLFKFPTAEELGGGGGGGDAGATVDPGAGGGAVDPAAAQAAIEAAIAAQQGSMPAGTQQVAEGAGQVAA
jgi:hypothetical protein